MQSFVDAKIVDIFFSKIVWCKPKLIYFNKYYQVRWC